MGCLNIPISNFLNQREIMQLYRERETAMLVSFVRI